MKLTFVCRQCAQRVRQEVGRDAETFSCPHCQRDYDAARGWRAGQLTSCPVCGCRELYVRKDFSQRLGVAIVFAGILLSSIAWGYHLRFVTYGVLFATALIDVVLYFSVGNMLQCYRCQAEYRGLVGLEEREPFDLETHERYRQQAARLAESEAGASDGGAGDAHGPPGLHDPARK